MVLEKNQNLVPRPPVVVILGHVDHGKTTILRTVRKIEFKEGKPEGMITQHIGAYQIEKDGKKITFLDTPGHEAFSQMRSRGAKVADIGILVIDCCQGIQAQTKEAITQAKLAQLPLIVALNKIDKKEANPEKVKRELKKEGVLVEDFGGKVPAVKVSAKTGQGISELLELILLVAEMENLKADLSLPARGVVIESHLDHLKGPTATLILSQGILKAGDIAATPSTLGKIKSLNNFLNSAIEKALPSEPVIAYGFENVPGLGEEFRVFKSLKEAREYLKPPKKIEKRVLKISPEEKVLNLILKADVFGSLEAIEEILNQIPQEEVVLRVIEAQVGQIREADLKLAKASSGLILGFRVGIDSLAKKIAQKEKIKIINFEVIYDLVEGLRKLMEKIKEPQKVRIDLGKMKVLAIFFSQKNRQIVGGKVMEGEIEKGCLVEILREEKIIGKGRLINLQKNKKDVEKVPKDQECGILYEGEEKIEIGDILIVYRQKKQL